MIILGLGGILDDAACALLKRWRIAGGGGRAQSIAASNARGLARRRHRDGAGSGRTQARGRQLRGPGTPVRAGNSFDVALAVSQRASSDGGASRGARGVGVLSVAVRGCNRVDAGSRWRFSIGGALARFWKRTASRKRFLLSGFAGRPVQPRYGIAGIQLRFRRAQGAVAFHRGLGRAVSTAIRGDPGRKRLAVRSTGVSSTPTV